MTTTLPLAKSGQTHQLKGCRVSSAVRRAAAPISASNLQRRDIPPLTSRRIVRGRLCSCRYTTEAQEFAVGQNDEEEEDFYTILGVTPNATEREIKRAYHNSMRSCHPDLAGEETEDATDICVCLNYVVDVLLDAEKRAAYDAIAGFSLTSVNPMRDSSLERDHLFVDEVTCIGCYACANACPKTFAMEDDFGRARVIRQGADPEELQQEAIDCCPVNAIHWTSAAQLTLLENVMQQLERVDVFLLFMGGGKSVDVFHEAELGWDKRQARLKRARMVADNEKRHWSQTASPAAGAASWEERQAASQEGRQAQKQRATAQAAAQAARRWRDHQRAKRKGHVALLADALTLDTSQPKPSA